jgi:cystathionine beta-lyase/cystathionine gamma-synthase
LTENERLSLGISENLIRLSIGLETVSDLKKDIATALK